MRITCTCIVQCSFSLRAISQRIVREPNCWGAIKRGLTVILTVVYHVFIVMSAAGLWRLSSIFNTDQVTTHTLIVLRSARRLNALFLFLTDLNHGYWTPMLALCHCCIKRVCVCVCVRVRVCVFVCSDFAAAEEMATANISTFLQHQRELLSQIEEGRSREDDLKLVKEELVI